MNVSTCTSHIAGEFIGQRCQGSLALVGGKLNLLFCSVSFWDRRYRNSDITLRSLAIWWDTDTYAHYIHAHAQHTQEQDIRGPLADHINIHRTVSSCCGPTTCIIVPVTASGTSLPFLLLYPATWVFYPFNGISFIRDRVLSYLVQNLDFPREIGESGFSPCL